MRRAIAAAVLISVCLGCTASPEKKNPDWHRATQTQRLNELFWVAVVKGRWTEVRDHLAPLAVLTEGQTRTTGADQIVERLKSEGFTAVQLGEFESQPAGADLVSSYTIAAGGTAPRRVLAVWQPVGKRTIVVALSIQ